MTGDRRNYARELEERISLEHADVEKLIRWYFPANEHTRAIWVAWQLSTMNQRDLSATKDNLWGLYHIDPEAVGLPKSEGWRLLDPIRNVAAAFKLWDHFGWTVFGLTIVDPPAAFDDDKESG
jgi:hypothetical protein